MMEDRPVALKRRRPVPAPDENVDPVSAMMERSTSAEAEAETDTAAVEPAPAPAETAPPKRKKREREIVFPFSTRLSQEAHDLIYEAVEEHGLSVREATEQAIMAHWGKG